MPVALSIAGSDPSGGAGLQLDLQVFRLLGVHGAGVLTALTIQDTQKVHRVLPVFPSVVLDQLRVLFKDLPLGAIKIGMLATDDVARSVELCLRDRGTRPAPVVLDPVLAASDGTSLLERRAWSTLLDLIPRTVLVTPNLPELADLVDADVSSAEGIEGAAKRLVEDHGAQAVLVKGGHRDGAPDDLLVRRGMSPEWLRNERIEGGPVRGTGCALSSAVVAEVAKGAELTEAIASARAFVRRGIQQARALGQGARLLGLS